MSYDEPPIMGRTERTIFTYTVLLWISPVLGLLLVLVLYFVLAGSGRQPATNRASGSVQSSDSGVELARQGLSRQTDLNACRNALQQINTEMGEKPAFQLPSLTDEQKNWLIDNLSLGDDELREVASSHYTRLDQHHLFRCLLLRDAADRLVVKGVRSKASGAAVLDRPLDQAARAFAWVMRQVRLRPAEGEAAPPAFVLQRGWGTALERAVIFLALLEQFGDLGAAQSELLGFLLQIPPSIPPAGRGEKGGGGSRLWACGVVVGDGKDVYLFDPHLGLPLPGPKGQGIATLTQARTQPEILAQLDAGEKSRYPVTMEQARTAQPHLVCPLSALSPRMRYLQDKLLAPVVRVRLASDAAKDRQRIEAACSAGAAKPTPVLASKDLCTLLRRFLPADDGGSDTTSRHQRFGLGLVSWRDLPPVFRDERQFPRESPLGQQVFSLFAAHFIAPTLEPDYPRDLLLRGRYRSAVEKLVLERGDLRNQVEQLANTADMQKKFRAWLDKAIGVYARQQRAKTPGEREQAERQVKNLWRGESSLPLYLILNGSASSGRGAEVAYQLALCSQEQAEQLQARLDLQKQTGAETFPMDVNNAQTAWRRALESWKSLEEDFPDHFDGAAARRLRGRAEAMLGDAKAAIASWQAVASWSKGKDKTAEPTDLERLACRYLAEQCKKQQTDK
jgi:hypothetical protein